MSYLHIIIILLLYIFLYFEVTSNNDRNVVAKALVVEVNEGGKCKTHHNSSITLKCAQSYYYYVCIFIYFST